MNFGQDYDPWNEDRKNRLSEVQKFFGPGRGGNTDRGGLRGEGGDISEWQQNPGKAGKEGENYIMPDGQVYTPEMLSTAEDYKLMSYAVDLLGPEMVAAATGQGKPLDELIMEAIDML